MSGVFNARYDWTLSYCTYLTPHCRERHLRLPSGDKQKTARRNHTKNEDGNDHDDDDGNDDDHNDADVDRGNGDDSGGGDDDGDGMVN